MAKRKPSTDAREQPWNGQPMWNFFAKLCGNRSQQSMAEALLDSFLTQDELLVLVRTTRQARVAWNQWLWRRTTLRVRDGTESQQPDNVRMAKCVARCAEAISFVAPFRNLRSLKLARAPTAAALAVLPQTLAKLRVQMSNSREPAFVPFVQALRCLKHLSSLALHGRWSITVPQELDTMKQGVFPETLRKLSLRMLLCHPGNVTPMTESGFLLPATLTKLSMTNEALNCFAVCGTELQTLRIHAMTDACQFDKLVPNPKSLAQLTSLYISSWKSVSMSWIPPQLENLTIDSLNFYIGGRMLRDPAVHLKRVSLSSFVLNASHNSWIRGRRALEEFCTTVARVEQLQPAFPPTLKILHLPYYNLKANELVGLDSLERLDIGSMDTLTSVLPAGLKILRAQHLLNSDRSKVKADFFPQGLEQLFLWDTTVHTSNFVFPASLRVLETRYFVSDCASFTLPHLVVLRTFTLTGVSFPLPDSLRCLECDTIGLSDEELLHILPTRCETWVVNVDLERSIRFVEKFHRRYPRLIVRSPE